MRRVGVVVALLGAECGSQSEVPARASAAATLGNIFSFGAAVATCHLDANSLRLTTPRPKSDQALLSAEGLE